MRLNAWTAQQDPTVARRTTLLISALKDIGALQAPKSPGLAASAHSIAIVARQRAQPATTALQEHIATRKGQETGVITSAQPATTAQGTALPSQSHVQLEPT